VPARLQPGVGQGVGDVDRAEAVGPAGQQSGGLQVGRGVVDMEETSKTMGRSRRIAVVVGWEKIQ
jgi:hypothetical protein